MLGAGDILEHLLSSLPGQALHRFLGCAWPTDSSCPHASLVTPGADSSLGCVCWAVRQKPVGGTGCMSTRLTQAGHLQINLQKSRLH